jgi:phosphoglycerate dehydrogenase-like enzyme
LGIIGTGSIGRRVIKRARGFGTSILAHDIRPDAEFASEWQVEYVSLDDLMARSDVVSIHTLLDENTRGLIDAQKLDLMKQTAYLVNTSRASIVEKAALLSLLQAKRIAGAALDVHDPTPCAPDDPLVQMDNVLATPHTAYNTKETVARMSISAAREVVAVLRGRSPRHPLNEVPLLGTKRAH